MSQLHVSQEMLHNCMASLANTAAQRPSRRIEPVEVLIKLKKCGKKEYEHFTGSVRLKHTPRPCFRVCIVGGEQDIQEAVANRLDFLDLPTVKDIGKVPEWPEFSLRSTMLSWCRSLYSASSTPTWAMLW
ncbi:large ribosomal subunit protein uL1-like isoform X2 [Dermacentor albipictus]|uniref:large ribosomal subunit protein uL1-like isoform X2 n=1 Tax=Dermacentor albipictus TaxID=60249 RepID=UPI0031FCF4DB